MVSWLIDRIINRSHRDQADRRVSNFLNEFSGALEWDANSLKLRADRRVDERRVLQRIIWGDVLVEAADDFYLLENESWGVSNNKISASEDALSVLLNPRKQLLLGDSMLGINFKETAESGLKNITVMIVESPFVENLAELLQMEFACCGAVKCFVVSKVGDTQQSESNRENFWLRVLEVVNAGCLDQSQILGSQVCGLVL